MDDSLQDLYQHLSLTVTESEEIVVVPEQLQDYVLGGDKCLIMKLFTDKHYNKDVFKSNMRKAWRLTLGVRFHDLSSTLMLVEFDDRRDKEKVIREGPWSFDKHLVLLKDVDGRKQVKQIQLTSASFWVRLHDLPLMAINEYVGWLLGEKIGIVEEVDVEEGAIAWGEFLRVRVNLQVSKPLLRGSMFSIGGGESVWVRFSYERLPNFCYLCGCLGHGEKDCSAINSKSKLSVTNSLPYGMWLHAGGYNERFFGGANRAKQIPKSVPAYSSGKMQPLELQRNRAQKGGGDVAVMMEDDGGSSRNETVSTALKVTADAVVQTTEVELEVGEASQKVTDFTTATASTVPKVTDLTVEQMKEVEQEIRALEIEEEEIVGHWHIGPTGPSLSNIIDKGLSDAKPAVNKPDGQISQKWKRVSKLHETTIPNSGTANSSCVLLNERGKKRKGIINRFCITNVYLLPP